MTHEHSEFARVVERAELEAEITARRSDLAAGLVPGDVRRALFAHEVTARANFAGIETDTTAAADPITTRLLEDRAQFLELLADVLLAAADTGGPDTPTTRIAGRLIELSGPEGFAAIGGVDALVADAERFHRGRLEVALDDALQAIVGEARAQGLAVQPVAVKLDAAQAEHLDLLARRLAVAPHADLLNALREQALVENRDFVTPQGLVERLRLHANTLSVDVLGQQARDAAAQANGIGRAATVDQLPPPASVFASELLDRNTCGPCSLVDGRSYPDLAAARIDYAFGTYVHCEGGSRCRGTLVFIWPSEVPATLPVPAA